MIDSAILKDINNILNGNLSDYDPVDSDSMSLMVIINLMGFEYGIELGTYYGFSSSMMLSYCPTIKKLYTIDKYQPYVDKIPPYIKVTKEDSSFFEKSSQKILNSTYDHVKSKIKTIVGDSLEVVHNFENEKYDFIFMDSHLSEDQLKNELKAWYPKIKNGGVVCVHDTDQKEIQETVENFISNKKISSNLGHFDNSTFWIK